MNDLTETQKAYLAGLIDGEGCISIVIEPSGNKDRWERFSCKTYISNTNRELLGEIYNIVGTGTISAVHKSVQTKQLHPEWKQVYNWSIYAKNMREFLPLLVPYLIAKREHAILALRFLALTKGQGYGSHLDEGNRMQRLGIATRLKQLNKRGTASI